MDSLILTTVVNSITPAVLRAMQALILPKGEPVRIQLKTPIGGELKEITLTSENIRLISQLISETEKKQESAPAKVVLPDAPGTVDQVLAPPPDHSAKAVLVEGVSAGRDIVFGNVLNPKATPIESPDPETLKVSLVQSTLVAMHETLSVELPRLKARNRRAGQLRLGASLSALVSNVSVLGALGVGSRSASLAAAVVALLVSGLKIMEDFLIDGITVKKPEEVQKLFLESTRVYIESSNVIASFNKLSSAGAQPNAYPLAEAERVADDLVRILPEMAAG
jgi:hypothetical protein